MIREFAFSREIGFPLLTFATELLLNPLKNLTMIAKVLYRLTVTWILFMIAFPAMADSSESVTVYVGETKTLTVPDYIADHAIITHFSIGYTDCLQRVSSNRTSIRVRGVKASGTTVLVTCNWQLSTLETGEHRFKVTVKERTDSSTGTLGEKDSVTLPDSIRLEVGESQSVTAITDAGMSVMWTWMGGDNSIATRAVQGMYDQTAVFTGVANGSTDVYAKSSKGGMARMNITVLSPVRAESVTLKPDSLVMVPGSEHTFEATVLPADATDGELTWTSSETSVAVVDGNGTVNAVGEGLTVITVTTRGGLIDRCPVNVRPETVSLVIDDEKDWTTNARMADITYTRRLYKGWNSFCLPFAMTLADLPEGCTMAAITNIQRTGNKYFMVLDSIVQTDAGVPFLVHAPEDLTMIYQGQSVPLVQSPVSGGLTTGCFTRTVIGKDCYKLNAEGTAFGITRTEDAVCAPFRLYIPVPDKGTNDFEPSITNLKAE